MKKLIFVFLLISQNVFSQALIPNPPEVSATSFLLMDAKTGTVITSSKPNEASRLASLTNNVNSYIVSDQISKGFFSENSQNEKSKEC